MKNISLLSNIKKGLIDESETLEFKECQNSLNIKPISKTITAFLNCQGGKIILGIQDGNKRFVGTSLNKNYVYERIREIFRYNFKKLSIFFHTNIEEIIFDDCKIIIITITKGNDPPYFVTKNKIENYFTRKKDNTVSMNLQEIKNFSNNGLIINCCELEIQNNKFWIEELKRKKILNVYKKPICGLSQTNGYYSKIDIVVIFNIEKIYVSKNKYFIYFSILYKISQENKIEVFWNGYFDSKEEKIFLEKIENNFKIIKNDKYDFEEDEKKIRESIDLLLKEGDITFEFITIKFKKDIVEPICIKDKFFSIIQNDEQIFSNDNKSFLNKEILLFLIKNKWTESLKIIQECNEWDELIKIIYKFFIDSKN